MMGYDTVFFNGENDSLMVRQALLEDRIILTKDTEIMKRHAVTTGRIAALLLTGDEPEMQVKQVVEALHLDRYYRPFSRCLECNQPLEEKSKEQVKEHVPPHVFQTQEHYMQCPACHRIYWRGTHWQDMHRRLKEFCGGETS